MNTNKLFKVELFAQFESVGSDFITEFKRWKRKNVTIRGIREMGQENGAGAMLGQGLYTAFLSNKALAREYGEVRFVLNAKPKNPITFNTLNDWEIWFQRNLLKPYDYKSRDFYKNTTIEKELLKMGYDGIVITGREMVNFTPPDNVLYFKNDLQLMNYFQDYYYKKKAD
jgi:hypothetical protein